MAAKLSLIAALEKTISSPGHKAKAEALPLDPDVIKGDAYRKFLPKKYRRGTRKIHRQNAAMLAAGTAIIDPADSDVAPIYLAEVDEANQNAVLELLAMVPASTEGSEPQILRYTANGWVSDPKILRQMQSTAPPAIVTLDEETFNSTLERKRPAPQYCHRSGTLHCHRPSTLFRHRPSTLERQFPLAPRRAGVPADSTPSRHQEAVAQRPSRRRSLTPSAKTAIEKFVLCRLL